MNEQLPGCGEIPWVEILSCSEVRHSQEKLSSLLLGVQATSGVDAIHEYPQAVFYFPGELSTAL